MKLHFNKISSLNSVQAQKITGAMFSHSLMNFSELPELIKLCL